MIGSCYYVDRRNTGLFHSQNESYQTVNFSVFLNIIAFVEKLYLNNYIDNASLYTVGNIQLNRGSFVLVFKAVTPHEDSIYLIINNEIGCYCVDRRNKKLTPKSNC